MNVSCTTSECPVLLNSSCVFYEGANLAFTGITTNDTVETVIQKLNAAIAGAAGTGTVTSFSSGNLSPLFTTSVATETTTPALTFTLSNQVANRVFAGPASGGAASPTFRALVAADIPKINGISAIGTSIGLGGTISVDTLLEMNPNLDIFIGDSGTGYGLIISTNTAAAGLSNFHGGIFVDGSGSMRVADGRLAPDIKGLEYNSDTYGADFSTASLIHKGFADSRYWSLATGGVLTGNNTITGAFDLSLGSFVSRLDEVIVVASSGITLDSSTFVLISTVGGAGTIALTSAAEIILSPEDSINIFNSPAPPASGITGGNRFYSDDLSGNAELFAINELNELTQLTTNIVSAPSTTPGTVIVNYYGSSATNFLGTPIAWMQKKIGATTYKIPLYT